MNDKQIRELVEEELETEFQAKLLRMCAVMIVVVVGLAALDFLINVVETYL